MQEQSLRELETKLAQPLDDTSEDVTRRRARKQIAEMIQNEEVLVLTDEEERMIREFRRFKLRMRKNGEVFTWQTSKPAGIVVSSETGLVQDPRSSGRLTINDVPLVPDMADPPLA